MNVKTVKFLSKAEKKNIKEVFENSYGVSINIEGYDFFITSREKLWVVAKGIRNLIKKLPNPLYMGLMIGKIKNNNKIKLSVEGSQLIGNFATKNVIEISNCKEYIFGEEPKIIRKINLSEHSFPIVKCKDYFLGSAGYVSNDKFINMFPTSRKKLVKK